ncbi:MAG: hypothetical protein ACXWJW_15500 [Xanthobacteraceae bacterium]
MKKRLTMAMLSAILTVALPAGAARADDIFQQAINYVFTGSIDPKPAPEIVDPKLCVVVVPDPNFKRFARYHMSRFKMNTSLIGKKYSGTRTLYELDVSGDDTILEYLGTDKTTVLEAFKSAQIPLPGDIDRTQKALNIIFADHCKPEQEKTPF